MAKYFNYTVKLNLVCLNYGYWYFTLYWHCQFTYCVITETIPLIQKLISFTLLLWLLCLVVRNLGNCRCMRGGFSKKGTDWNITSTTSVLVKKTEKLTLPYGRPRVLQKRHNYCLLYHYRYVNAYSKDYRMSLWNAYTINKDVSSWIKVRSSFEK